MTAHSLTACTHTPSENIDVNYSFVRIRERAHKLDPTISAHTAFSISGMQVAVEQAFAETNHGLRLQILYIAYTHNTWCTNMVHHMLGRTGCTWKDEMSLHHCSPTEIVTTALMTESMKHIWRK